MEIIVKGGTAEQVFLVDEAVKKLNFSKLRLKFQTYQPPIRERLDKLERLFHETLGSDESIRLEWLYKTARKRDYNQTRRTFQRDISLLEQDGKIKTTVMRGGKHGNTTFLQRFNSQGNPTTNLIHPPENKSPSDVRA